MAELPAPEAAPAATPEELDAEEQEFRALRRDLPGVKGASAGGIVAISVGKAPNKNEFFRSHREFRPTVSLVDVEVGMEKQFFAVTPDMVDALAGIGITVSDYTLYLTITSRGALRVVPVRQANSDGEQNEYHRTKEIGLIQAVQMSGCAYTPTKRTAATRSSPHRVGRFSDPQWPTAEGSESFPAGLPRQGPAPSTASSTLLFNKWAARHSD